MRKGNMSSALRQIGATRVGVWIIKHIVSPLDRWLYRWTNGRFLTSGRPLAPTLLLTTTGRKTGQPRTTPVFYLRDGDRVIICNVNPGFERPNPWTLNIRANKIVRAQISSKRQSYEAREATAAEIEKYWPQLVKMWPAYQRHFENSGQRSIFILE
jgi:deazaflavin-dependent oxidoreductase (nitroreductase family)